MYLLLSTFLYSLSKRLKFCLASWIGGVAQLARAPALQAGGQEFDSPHLHQHIEKYIDKEKMKVN